MTQDFERANGPNPGYTSPPLSILTFRLGEQVYGLPVQEVVQIIEMVAFTRLPQAPFAVQGVINLRGKIVPVLDLRLRFDLPLNPTGFIRPSFWSISRSRPWGWLWSAGCATGEEAYSLAMLLHELIPDLKNWDILILATDINQDSLARARQALYSDWSFRESRAKTSRALYFSPQGRFYRLCDPIRHMVTFAPLNLIEDNFPSPHNNTVSMDLIICRNVTIYFTEETTRGLVQKFYRGLAQGGWLVVGHADLSLTTYRAFQARSFPNTVMYQKSGEPTSEPVDRAGPEPAPISRTGPLPHGALAVE